jgi:hypothetical protein
MSTLKVRMACQVAAALLAGHVLFGQQRPPDVPITKSEISTVVRGAADLIERLYVDPIRGRQIAAALRLTVDDATFDGISSSLALVPRFNRLLAQVGADAHLRLGYSYEPQTAAADRPETADELDARRRQVAASGYGVQRVDRLEGNVGLLELNGFRDVDLAGEAVAGALRLLNSTDALIIDLRGSAGGDADMVRFLSTYFFGEPVHLADFYHRPTDTTEQWWTLPWVPGLRYLDRDVFILTSSQTFSAAEGFTYHLQQRQRAVVVGEQTKGGAHTGKFERVTPHFAVFVPEGRVTDAISHGDWERAGVRPDVPVDRPAAFKTAYVLALERLVKRAHDPEVRAALEAVLERVKAQSASTGLR